MRKLLLFRGGEAMKLWLIIGLLLMPSTLLAQCTGVTSCTALSLSSTDVQNALNSINLDNTTLTLPAGSATWTTTVTYNQSKSTIIQGQTTVTGTCAPGGTCTVTDNTSITDNLTRGAGCGSPDNPALNINTILNKTFRMTGVTFNFTGTQTCNGSILISGTGQSIRIDHNHFNQQFSTGIHWTGWTFGVNDHNFFEAPNGVWNALKFEEGSWNNDSLGVGDQSWAAATGFGTSQFVFVENNEFHSTFNGALSYANDCTSGGRYVWRYNLELNISHQTHPTGGGQRHRGCRATEIYNNVDTGTGGAGADFVFFFLSSGSSLVWGNTVDSTFHFFFSLNSMRRDNSTYNQAATPNGWGFCGTTFNGTGSNWDQNTSTSTGYRCLDQPGQGVGQLLVNDFPNTVNQSTGTIAWPNEALEPVYAWINNSSALQFITNNESDALIANADYYTTASSFNGTSGTGSGLLSSRPATCTVKVAYWATDTNTLYTCNTTNTWTAYYTPFTYPHPLISGGGTPIATFTPNPLSIGQVPAGLTSNPVPFTLKNTGTGNLVVTAITPDALFALVNNTCGTSFTLTPSQSCTFQVTTSPVSVGPFSGGITFSDNAGNPDVLPITGQGTGPSAPAVTIFAGRLGSGESGHFGRILP